MIPIKVLKCYKIGAHAPLVVIHFTVMPNKSGFKMVTIP